ncbi:phosphoribosylaminoimidazolesuccinocarboxamide synthase [Ignisphaera sp. 4213-co]|uniref:Phosphoribosylaminoimidazole-succinocarboxamide synthase n=1 Tax=Ignisphaera cupida TaxID=3050454 RepID=A0ABD4Z5N4_9CREN|nr:phosphoribosylaminoimidazolesuccinocarboxamide synthase [Ignisphaera sp. 4213-co]MDK6028215.1 phosphoribosylaminoimidazolesuccinocarboxamide synthase [Ignisphaera sp. 4213-co]
MNTLQLIYEGKSKRVYAKDEDTLVIEFKDDVTAIDGLVKAVAIGKGVLAARISAFFFKLLNDAGIKTHFIEYDGFRRIIVKKLEIIPVEVIVRNYAYGSLLRRLPIYKPLQKLEPPLLEFHYKDDDLHDPLVLEEDLIRTGILSEQELDFIKSVSLRVNDILTKFFESKKLKFVDVKLEFGKSRSGEILVADEISGDTFRVLDENGNHLDKEVFRRTKDAGLLLKAYLRLAEVVGVSVDGVFSSY